MDEPFAGRVVAEGVSVTVDCAHPLFVAADVKTLAIPSSSN